ncbi:hypothetical protein, partial [Escherichia marmotae]|uniref:hypothetical protein n=1 Tax=Escherichia marmotae TaxID=1499973 RepID=UPI0027E14FF6
MGLDITPVRFIVRGAGVALLPGVLLNGHHRWRFNKTYPVPPLRSPFVHRWPELANTQAITPGHFVR